MLGDFEALALASGSLIGEPVIVSNEKAIQKLKGIADYFLTDNAEAPFPADDSLVKVIAGKPVFIRRARGYSPTTIRFPDGLGAGPDILALGGAAENSICAVKGSSAYLSNNLGDLQNAESFDNFKRTAAQLMRFCGLTLDVVAHDLGHDCLHAIVHGAEHSSHDLPIPE